MSDQTPLAAVTVIDRPALEADHLFVAAHGGKKLLGAVDNMWQRDPTRRARSGLAPWWQDDPAAYRGVGDRLRSVLPAPGEPEWVGALVVYDVQGRPAFEVSESLVSRLGDGHGDEQEVARLRQWYEAAWKVVAFGQFITEVVDLRAALLASGRSGVEVHRLESEAAHARLGVTRARATLATIEQQS